MDLQLSGKRFLITGGSGGMGPACARRPAREGCRADVAASLASPRSVCVNAVAGGGGTGGSVHD